LAALILSAYGVENAGPKGDPASLSPSSSMANIPLGEILREGVFRERPTDAGGVWLAWGDARGGRKGPEEAALADAALAFSSLSALKKRSRGDSSRWNWFADPEGAGGVFRAPKVEASLVNLGALIPGESGTDLE